MEVAANRSLLLACSKEAAAKHMRACCTQYIVISRLSISSDACEKDDHETKDQPYNSSTMPEMQTLAEICWMFSHRDPQVCPSSHVERFVYHRQLYIFTQIYIYIWLSVMTAGVTLTNQFDDGVTSAEPSDGVVRRAESSILSVQLKF